MHWGSKIQLGSSTPLTDTLNPQDLCSWKREEVRRAPLLAVQPSPVTPAAFSAYHNPNADHTLLGPRGGLGVTLADLAWPAWVQTSSAWATLASLRAWGALSRVASHSCTCGIPPYSQIAFLQGASLPPWWASLKPCAGSPCRSWTPAGPPC